MGAHPGFGAPPVAAGQGDRDHLDPGSGARRPALEERLAPDGVRETVEPHWLFVRHGTLLYLCPWPHGVGSNSGRTASSAA